MGLVVPKPRALTAPPPPFNFFSASCFAQALCINVAEILNDYGIYAMFHELLREAGE